MEQRPQRACVAQQQQHLAAAAGEADQPAAAAASQQQQQQQAAAAAELPGGPHAALQAAVMELSMALSAAEADKALAAATAAAMPLLRAACGHNELVASVRQNLVMLHAAACAGGDPSAALQQALSSVRELGKAAAAAAVPALGEPTAALAAATAAGGKRPPESPAAAPSAKQAKCAAAPEQRAWLEQEPCGGCGDPAGEQVLCDFCMASWHLGCCSPPLEAVPPGTWLCGSCSSVEGRLAETEEALALHSRWVQAKAPRVSRPFFGQLSYWAQGRLSLQFQDGEVWTGLTAHQGSGRVTLEGYSWVRLMPQTASVPVEVVQLYENKGWLVAADEV